MVFSNTAVFLVPSDHFVEAMDGPAVTTVKSVFTSNSKQVHSVSSIVTVTTSLLDSSTTENVDARDYAVKQEIILRCNSYMISFNVTKGDANGYSKAVITGQSGGNSDMIGTPVTLTFAKNNNNDNSSTKEGTLSMAKVTDPTTSTSYLQYTCNFETDSDISTIKFYKITHTTNRTPTLRSVFTDRPTTMVGGSNITIYAGYPVSNFSTSNSRAYAYLSEFSKNAAKISAFAGTFTQTRSQTQGGRWKYFFNPEFRKYT